MLSIFHDAGDGNGGRFCNPWFDFLRVQVFRYTSSAGVSVSRK